MAEYMLLDFAARMPQSCWGRYRRIGVVELTPGFEGAPKMLSLRARGVARIVQTWERLHHGKTDRDAYSAAIRDAHTLLLELRA